MDLKAAILREPHLTRILVLLYSDRNIGESPSPESRLAKWVAHEFHRFILAECTVGPLLTLSSR